MRFDYFCRYLRLYSHKCYYLYSIFQIGFFSFPWRLAWTFQSPCSEVPCCALQRCAAPCRGEQHQLAVSFWMSPEAYQAGVRIPTRAGRWRSFVNDLQNRDLLGFNEKKWVVRLNLIPLRLCCRRVQFYSTRKQAPEKSCSAALTMESQPWAQVV